MLEQKKLLTYRPIFNKTIYQGTILSYLIYFNPNSSSGIVLIHSANKGTLKMINGKNTINDILKTTQDINRRNLILELLFKLKTHGIISYENVTEVQVSRKTEFKIGDVWIDMTNQCNFRCKYCFTSKDKEVLTKKKGKEIIFRIFEEAKKNNFDQLLIKFAGGEPLLNIKTILLLKKHIDLLAQKYKIPTTAAIVTNGSLLSDKNASLLKQNNIIVNISLDGVGEIQNKTRVFKNGGGTYNYVEKGIEIAKKYGILSHFIITVNKHNVKEILPIAKKATGLGISINIDFCKTYYDGSAQSGLKADNEVIIKSLKKVYRYLCKINNNLGLPPFKKHGLLDIISFEKPKMTACAAGTEYYYAVSCGGYVRACPALQENITVISEKNFSRKLSQTRFADLKIPPINSNCFSCLWKARCGGGCPAEKYSSSQNNFSHSSYCEVYKNLIPYILKLEAKRMIHEAAFNS